MQLCKQYETPTLISPYNIVSDTAENVAENINKGLLDFGLMLRQTKNEGLDYIPLDYKEHTVVLFRNDSPLAEKEVITLEDLIDIPLLVPSTYKHSKILGEYQSKDEGGILTFVATYNLLYNAARLVENGFGVAITLEGLVNVSQSANLAYKPLKKTRLSYRHTLRGNLSNSVQMPAKHSWKKPRKY